MPHKFECPVGKRWGRIEVVADGEPEWRWGRYHRMWLVRCDCGSEFLKSVSEVNSGRTRQCLPCYRARLTKHGDAKRGLQSREYRIWSGLKGRCLDPLDHKYPSYGGRGIKVCARWVDDYANFLTDMGRAPSNKHQIDRKNNDGDYEPGNCRWVTPKENARNKRTNRIVTAHGISMTASQWAERLGVSRGVIYNRLDRGWGPERAVSERKHG